MQATRAWYLLNFIPKFPLHSDSAISFVDNYNADNNTELEIFAPRFTAALNGDDKLQLKPLLYHYVILRGTEAEVRNFCARGVGFSPVRTAIEGNYLIVPDASIEAFRSIARFYSNALPCFSITDIDLMEGDLVEVAEGDFKGLQGVFIPKKRGKSGRIVVNLTHNLASAVFDIKVDYLRVIEFAKGSRRAYDQVDAFVPRLFNALRAYSSDALTPALAAPLIVFGRRFGTVRLENPKMEAKLYALLAATYYVLSDVETASGYLIRYNQRAEKITNANTRALISLIFSLSRKSPAEKLAGELVKAYRILGEPQPKESAAIHNLRNEFRYYLEKL